MIWFVLLGVLLSGYLVLASIDHGVAIAGRDLRLIQPFLLGNQVWMVAVIGVLFVTFPHAEGKLLSAYYPPVGLLLAGLVTLVVSVLLGTVVGGWRTASRLGGVAAAAGMGWLSAALLIGRVWHPVALAGAVAMVVLVAVHGIAFANWRESPRDNVLPEPDGSSRPPVARRGIGPLVGTSTALVLPVVLLGLISYPNFPGLSMSIADASADQATLDLLTWGMLPALPVLVGVQAFGWWLFTRSPARQGSRR